MRKYWMHTLSNMWYKPHYIPKLRAMDILLFLLLLIDSYFHPFLKLHVDYNVFYFEKLIFLDSRDSLIFLGYCSNSKVTLFFIITIHDSFIGII